MQVACDSTGPDGSFEFGVVVGMTVTVNASYADHAFALVSNTVANASSIYVTGPIAGLNFQVGRVPQLCRCDVIPSGCYLYLCTGIGS